MVDIIAIFRRLIMLLLLLLQLTTSLLIPLILTAFWKWNQQKTISFCWFVCGNRLFNFAYRRMMSCECFWGSCRGGVVVPSGTLQNRDTRPTIMGTSWGHKNNEITKPTVGHCPECHCCMNSFSFYFSFWGPTLGSQFSDQDMDGAAVQHI
jgi:hypothetical protein